MQLIENIEIGDDSNNPFMLFIYTRYLFSILVLFHTFVTYINLSYGFKVNSFIVSTTILITNYQSEQE